MDHEIAVGRDLGLSRANRSPRAIAGAFARLINSGELAPGDRLPTVREVAAQLGVSPATVSEAWQALRRAGMIVSRGRAGSFVQDELPTSWLSPRVRGLLGDQADQPLDLSRGTPDPALLPALAPALAAISPQRAGTGIYQEAPVIPEFAAFLEADWPGPAPRITVTDGALDAIARVLSHVVHFGDVVAVECPGFPPFFDLIDALGAELAPMALDHEGVRPDELARALRRRPRAVVLQPRAHNPTGVSWTTARTEELAAVITEVPEARDTVIIEDDHSSQISAAAEVSLAKLLPDRVVHVRSFSKSLGPDLRIAAMSGPVDLVDLVIARRMLGPGWTSRMMQRIALELLTAVSSVEQVADARRIYAARLAAIRRGLRQYGVEVPSHDGINLWLPVADERAALVHLAAVGIRVAGGTPFDATHDRSVAPHVRVTVGVISEGFDAVAGHLATAARAAPAGDPAGPRDSSGGLLDPSIGL